MTFIDIAFGVGMFFVTWFAVLYTYGMAVAAISYLIVSIKIRPRLKISRFGKDFWLDLVYLVAPLLLSSIVVLFAINNFVFAGMIAGVFFGTIVTKDSTIADNCIELFARRYAEKIPKDMTDNIEDDFLALVFLSFMRVAKTLNNVAFLFLVFFLFAQFFR